MLLSLHVFEDVLSPLHFSGSMVDSWDTLSCSYPLIVDTGITELSEGPLYIARAADIPDEVVVRGHPSLLLLGKPSEKLSALSCNVLWTPDDISLRELANRIAAEFARYQSWCDRMQQAVDDEEGPGALAEASAGIFSNPIYAMGPEMYVICSYTPCVQEDTERYAAYRERYHMGFGSYEGPEVIVDPLTMEDYFEMPPSPTPSVAWSPFGHEVLYHSIYHDNELVATVCLDAIVAPITDRDRALSVIWGKYLRRLLIGRAGRSFRQSRAYGHVLHGLLDHVLQPEKSIQGFLQQRGWADAHEYLVCVMRNNSSPDETLAEYLAQSVMRNMREACFEIREGSAVIIFNLTRMGTGEGELAKRLMGLTRDKDLTVSCSRQFEGFRYLWFYYQQALVAERQGTMADPTLWLYRYEDYEVADILRRITQGTMAATFIPAGLRNLMRHDQKHDGIYVQTLRTYLECERNVAETSRRLYVHRNTFLYRLSRIEKLLDLDLSDSDTRLMLLIVLRLVA